MIWLIRLGTYALSGLFVWQFFQDGTAGFLPAKHLTLDAEHGMIFGVCAGLSNYSGIDVSFIRLLWVLLAVYRGLGIGLYIIAFLIMPVIA
jgi:phage shock protein PspC (stress-responsive transcriptional regulator)